MDALGSFIFYAHNPQPQRHVGDDGFACVLLACLQEAIIL